MVLLSALVLLLLPALLCHAAPMDTGASSSSGAHYPAIDAEPNVPGDRSGIKKFHYYHTLFLLDPNMPTLTNDKYEEHFGTRIHYKGTPVLFTDADPDTKVQHALKHYGKVWLVGPPRLLHDSVSPCTCTCKRSCRMIEKFSILILPIGGRFISKSRTRESSRRNMVRKLSTLGTGVRSPNEKGQNSSVIMCLNGKI
ncbi:uncharacterized protein UHOD_03616 [Ustilago sp. UG-2017b]|nr:uncharacterized protein UHOD_03616 [Ustilago sp. UG-2017b]